ncbi:MAG TPA: penicillin-binding protein activator LpoB, partial [Longimicrobiales bacterium]|nr:penicillin-binding protein activator LpoB [Longimicrobiales bacterium]
MTRSSVPAALRVGLVLAVAGFTGACASKSVSRIDPASVTDLSGRWNDTDSRLVANALIEQSLSGPWAIRHTESHGGESPAVIVGTFRNRSMEHIPVETFLNDLERAFVNTGAVRLVASPTERQEVRAEREDQQQHARADSRARLAQELGANYMLQGEIQTIEDQEGREKVVYYQIDATLVDVESNLRVWAGQHKIKKYI